MDSGVSLGQPVSSQCYLCGVAQTHVSPGLYGTVHLPPLLGCRPLGAAPNFASHPSLLLVTFLKSVEISHPKEISLPLLRV